MRDLAAVLALPAAWRTLDPARTVSSLVEVVLGLLRADFVFAVAIDRREQFRASDFYPRGSTWLSLRQELDRVLGGDDDTTPDLSAIQARLHSLGMRFAISIPRGQQQSWTVIAGSTREDFPTTAERFLMDSAAEQAAIAVEKVLLIGAERRARTDAEAANAAKSGFLANMSHELRTPLNAISGYVELLEMGVHGPITEQQEGDLARIRRSARHLLGLINDILNFAKIEAGHIDIRLGVVSLCTVLATLRDWIDPQLRSRSLEFDCQLPDTALAIKADVERLHQILLNLLSNAMKFTPPGGRISVFCTTDESIAYVHVRDTGAGIAAEKLDRIFDPFVQGDQSFARASEGVGLGLAISRDLARAMGGDLTVQSTHGVGSTFTLPLSLA